MNPVHYLSAERRRRRTRHLYALRFQNRRVYIGQTVNPERRFSEHRKVWPEPFTTQLLNKIEGDYVMAEDYEHAWRVTAKRAGYAVFGLPGVIVNPSLQMSPERARIAETLRWPEPQSTTAVWLWIVFFILLLALARLVI